MDQETVKPRRDPLYASPAAERSGCTEARTAQECLTALLDVSRLTGVVPGLGAADGFVDDLLGDRGQMVVFVLAQRAEPV